MQVEKDCALRSLPRACKNAAFAALIVLLAHAGSFVPAEVARERAKPMHVTEHHPLRLNAEAPDHARERREARKARLAPEDTGGHARHSGAQQAMGVQRHRRSPNQLSHVLRQYGERAWEHLDQDRFEAGE